MVLVWSLGNPVLDYPLGTQAVKSIRLPSRYYPKGPSEIREEAEIKAGRQGPHKGGGGYSKGVRWWTPEEDRIIGRHLHAVQQALLKVAPDGKVRSPLQIAHRIGKLVYAQEHELGPEGLDRLRP